MSVRGRPTRRRLLLGAAALALPPAGVAAWACGVEPLRLVVSRYHLPSPGWPPGAASLRVGFVSDLHVGCLHVDRGTVERVVRVLAAQRPDIVLYGGDFVVSHAPGSRFVPARDFADVLASVEPPLGRWAVLGNHDWWEGGRAVRHALEAAGIGVLENEAVKIDGRGQMPPFWLAGFADDTTRPHDVAGTLRQASGGAPILAMAHDPATFLEMPTGPMVTLCGHTHGGQVSLPFHGAFENASRAPLAWSYGFIGDAGRNLIVSGGIGTSVLPIRWGVPPEIVVLEISAA